MQVRNTRSNKTVRKVASKGTSQADKGRKAANGSGQTTIEAIAPGQLGLHFLTKDIRAKSMFELMMLSGFRTVQDDNEERLLDLIDTEQKQLQCISDLYEIVKAQPKYKALKEPKFSAETSPIHVIQWLLRKLGPLANGDNWLIDTYSDNGKTRYCFVVYRSYNSQKLIRAAWIELDFLPGLKPRDEQLHDLIIDVLAMVCKYNKIPLWDNDGDFSTAIANLSECHGAAWATKDSGKYHELYSAGSPAEYLKLIRQRQNTVTLADIRGRIVEYNANSNRKRSIIWWLRCGLDLAAGGQNIKTYTYLPSFYPENTVTPFRSYKIVWYDGKDDEVARAANAEWKDDDNYGRVHAQMFSITKPGQKIQNVNARIFPVELSEFMYDGWRIFHTWYRDYFYKPKVEVKSNLLIDILA